MLKQGFAVSAMLTAAIVLLAGQVGSAQVWFDSTFDDYSGTGGFAHQSQAEAWPAVNQRPTWTQTARADLGDFVSIENFDTRGYDFGTGKFAMGLDASGGITIGDTWFADDAKFGMWWNPHADDKPTTGSVTHRMDIRYESTAVPTTTDESRGPIFQYWQMETAQGAGNLIHRFSMNPTDGTIDLWLNNGVGETTYDMANMVFDFDTNYTVESVLDMDNDEVYFYINGVRLEDVDGNNAWSIAHLGNFKLNAAAIQTHAWSIGYVGVDNVWLGVTGALKNDVNLDGVEDGDDINYIHDNPADLDGQDLDGDENFVEPEDFEYFLSDARMGVVRGDATTDGFVNEADLAWLADGWKQGTGFSWKTGDFTFDGEINEADLAWLADNWKANEGGGAQAVPEPASLALLGLGGLVAVRRRAHAC